MHFADNCCDYRENRLIMMRNLIELLQRYSKWVRQLSRESKFMFAARSPLGRSAKISLFGGGVLMPLGSLIWIALYWHGKSVEKQRNVSTAVPLITDA
jgi:hypothetical protein